MKLYLGKNDKNESILANATIHFLYLISLVFDLFSKIELLIYLYLFFGINSNKFWLKIYNTHMVYN